MFSMFSMFRFECRLMCVYCVCQIAARASPAEQFIDLLRSPSLRRDGVDKHGFGISVGSDRASAGMALIALIVPVAAPALLYCLSLCVFIDLLRSPSLCRDGVYFLSLCVFMTFTRKESPPEPLPPSSVCSVWRRRIFSFSLSLCVFMCL